MLKYQGGHYPCSDGDSLNVLFNQNTQSYPSSVLVTICFICSLTHYFQVEKVVLQHICL